MDFPVEATVDLNLFGNRLRVQEILRSHGFQVVALGGGQVRVEGSFSQLRSVKSQLEPLVRGRRPSSGNGLYDDTGSRSGGLPIECGVSPNVAEAPPGACGREALSRSPQTLSTWPTRETFVVDSDVFRYAHHFRKKDMKDILTAHAVSMTVQEHGDGSTVTLRGSNSNAAACKLQSLLHHLGNCLRTQEVPWADLDGDALLERIRQRGNVYNLVLVRDSDDGLHLVGPPTESFQLQRQLKGNTAGGGGRSYERGAGLGTGSLSAVVCRDKGQSLSGDSSPLGGAAGCSLPRKPDDRTELGHEAGRRRLWLSFRRQSHLGVGQKRKTDLPERLDMRQNPTTTTSVTRILNWFKKKHLK